MVQRAVIGVDPGRKTGAVAVIEQGGAVIRVCKNFAKDDDEGDLLGGESVSLMREYQGRAVAVVERIPPFMFSFNPITKQKERKPMHGNVVRHYGAVLGCLQGLRIPIIQLTPAWWQTVMNCRTGGNKRISKDRATELFDLKVSFRITDWNSDALLLAACGWRLMRGEARINGMADPRGLWPC